MDIRNLPEPQGVLLPAFHATPALVRKILGGFAVSTVGVYMLGSGRKQQDVQKMLLGAALILGALFLL